MISTMQQPENDLPVFSVGDCHADTKEKFDPLVPVSTLRQAATLFPTTEEETSKVNDMLAKEMEGLSFAERDRILFDIYGINKHEDENLDKISHLLQRLDEELQKPHKRKGAYQRAMYLNEEYVTKRSFRLMFLRSEDYDPGLAADRMIQHFHSKQTLFGSGEILARDIRLSDLSVDDMECLESGFCQMFKSRDVSGRVIWAFIPRHRVCKTNENAGRAMWYMIMSSLLCDEEMQKKGVVLNVYDVCGQRGVMEELGFLRVVLGARIGIPTKIMAAHNAQFDPSVRMFVAGVRLFLGKEIRTKMKDHSGSYSEVIFKMQTFGINAEDHPINDDLSLNLDFHNTWIKIRKNHEEANMENSASDNIIVPRRFDVLFGRGRTTREHTGNLRAGHIVDMHYAAYEKAGKYKKTNIAEEIVNIIHASCGRFLKWEQEKGWVEVDFETARDKVSHFFRQKRSKIAEEQRAAAGGPTSRPMSPKRASPCPSPDPEPFRNAKRIFDPIPL